MSQVNTFIFDIDGTLIDSFDMYMPSMIEILRRHGYEIAPEDEDTIMKKYFGITGLDALKLFGVKPEEIELIHDEWVVESDKRRDFTKALDQIPEALDALSKVPGNRLAVATSKLRDEYEYFEKQYDFAKHFEVAIASEDTEKHKPSPDPILAALDRMGVKPENAVYVGDTINDLLAAKAAGVKFAGANYGSVNPSEIKDADYLLDSPMDLLKI
ncbi:MAG: HAD-IA family hydrolase [Limosilactobacillus sp.]|uniref:HAD family hydrolase n=1 Tax=Limosilactobacillus sp. TaxID=2773925 RepID=UPI0026F4EC8D|nr:HAD-IA family hydrolase [Limosilactobacillus sp.]